MVPAALWAQVALFGLSVGVRDGVVEVGLDGLGSAAGGVACGAAGADQVGELATGCGLTIVAAVAGDGNWDTDGDAASRVAWFRLEWPKLGRKPPLQSARSS